MNSVFRVYKYPTNYAAFNGRTLTPGSFVELYQTDVIRFTWRDEFPALRSA